MSTHALGDVQLITVQEVEAMLDEVVVPETSIDAKVAAEAAARESADQLLQGNIDNERAEREAADTTLQANITAETTSRKTADDSINIRITNEVGDRETADFALSDRISTVETGLADEVQRASMEEQKIRAEIKQTEIEQLSNVYCTRFTNLPIATVQISNTDKSVGIGDTIATLSARYLPKIPVDFVMTSEQVASSASSTYLLTLRIDTSGNINVINMFKLTDSTSATDVASVTYITKE